MYNYETNGSKHMASSYKHLGLAGVDFKSILSEPGQSCCESVFDSAF